MRKNVDAYREKVNIADGDEVLIEDSEDHYNRRKATAANLRKLTAAQVTDLTDGGDTTLHYHAADRVLSPTQVTDLTDGNDSTAHYHAADRAWANQTGLPDTFQANLRNGLETPSDWTLSYDESTRVFTATAGDDTNVYAGGNLIAVADNAVYPSDSPTPAHPDTTALYFWYFTSASENIQRAASFPDIAGDAAIVAYAYYNATTNNGVLFDERHPNTWNSYIHKHVHLYQGAVLYSGGTISGHTPDTNGDTNTQFAIAETVFNDESILHTVAQLTKGGPYTIWYRSGADAANEWSWDIAATVPYGHNGDDPYYNQLSGGNWLRTAITDNSRWVNYWLCATNAYNDGGNNWKHRFLLIMGQTLHTTLAAAQAQSFLTALSFGLLPFAEIIPLYRITFRRVSDPAEKNVQIDEVARIVGTNVTSITAVAPTTHNALAGRDATSAHPGTAIALDTTGFTGCLSETDTNVQTAITTLMTAINGLSSP